MYTFLNAIFDFFFESFKNIIPFEFMDNLYISEIEIIESKSRSLIKNNSMAVMAINTS